MPKRVNQQSQRILYAGAELNRLYPECSISMSNHAVYRHNEAANRAQTQHLNHEPPTVWNMLSSNEL
jgi:hypothetical protein